MDSDATEDQRALLDVSVRFMEETCPPAVVRDAERRDAAFAAGYRSQAAELGWFSMLVPEALGGGSLSGNGVLDAALIAYLRGGRLQPGAFVGTNVVADAIARAGGARLQEEVLPALVAGEASAAWALAATAGVGSPAAGVDARTDGAGGLVLSGAKTAVLDVEPGGWLLVTASSPDGPVQAVVAVDAPGVGIVALDSLDLSRRFSEVRLDGVVVAADAVLGDAGSTAALIDHQLAVAATLLAAECVGAMDAEFAMTLQYAKDRIAFGRPIGSFQAIKHVLADTSLAVEMSKAITLAAARTLGSQDDHGPAAASMAKALVGDSAIDLAQNCFQVFGGIGYTWEHDQHLYLRRVTSDAGLFGDAAWHREHLCQLSGI